MSDNKYAEEVMGNIGRMLDSIPPQAITVVAEQLIKSDIIVTFGNGGSYANATHLVCDLLLRTKIAKSIHSIGDNTSMFSACCNDFSFEEAVAFELERYVSGPGIKTVVLFSTSGDSKNVVRAARAAKRHGCTVIAIFGMNLDKVEKYTDMYISVGGKKSGQIEAVHSAVCHTIVDVIRDIMGEDD